MVTNEQKSSLKCYHILLQLLASKYLKFTLQSLKFTFHYCMVNLQVCKLTSHSAEQTVTIQSAQYFCQHVSMALSLLLEFTVC